MSIRTIIEINHDYLAKLTPERLALLVDALKSSTLTRQLNFGSVEIVSGVRAVAQRHHSNECVVKISGLEINL